MNEQEAIKQLSAIVGEPCTTLEEAVAVVRSVVRDLEDSKWFWYERHARTRRMVEKGAYIRQELKRAHGACEVGLGDEIEVDRRMDAVFCFLDECLLELRYLDSWPARGPFLLPERCPRWCPGCGKQWSEAGYCDECDTAALAAFADHCGDAACP